MDSETTNNAPKSETQVPVSGGEGSPKRGLPKFIKTLLMIGVVVVVGIVILGIFLFNYTADAIQAADKVVDDIRNGRCINIYNDQTTTYFRSLGTAEQWQEECSRIGAILTGEVTNDGLEISSDSGENPTSDIGYTIDGNDDLTYDVDIRLEKVDGEWKMDSFSSTARE